MYQKWKFHCCNDYDSWSFSHAQTVSTDLKGKSVDLASAIGMIDNLNKMLNKKEEIKTPRTVSVQRHRANYETQTPED